MSDAVTNRNQLEALIDAKAAINDGGLIEVAGARGRGYMTHDGHGSFHELTVIEGLRDKGLVEIIGNPPVRRVKITETGIMELDCAGVAS